MLRSLFTKIKTFLRATNASDLESFQDVDNNRSSDGLSTERSVLEDLGALAASIEHNIRNPLMVIQTEITRLRKKRQADSEVIDHLEYIEEQLEKIFAATEIVTLMRGRADYFGQYMEKTRIGDLIHKTLKAVKKEVDCTDIFFTYGENTPGFVKAHRSMLEQAMTNVIKNAVEAIREVRPQGGVVDIQVKTDVLSETVRVDVIDNGCGIPEENIANVATLFSTKGNKKANSGIGLFITARILKLHLGSLEVRSNLGASTTVSVVLPMWTANPNLGIPTLPRSDTESVGNYGSNL